MRLFAPNGGYCRRKSLPENKAINKEAKTAAVCLLTNPTNMYNIRVTQKRATKEYNKFSINTGLRNATDQAGKAVLHDEGIKLSSSQEGGRPN